MTPGGSLSRARWLLGVAALVVVAAMGALALRPRPVPHERPARSLPRPDHEAVPIATVPVPVAEQASRVGRERRFERRTADVREACDLPLVPRCEGARCAAVVESPSLDGFGGWIEIATDRPGLVVSTVLRDAGIDPSWTPCGRALDQLAELPIYSVTDPETGREWWCTVDARQGTDARDLCDALVSDRTSRTFDRFGARPPRRLRFRRDP
ncbi:MAG: hypothetical protein AAF602_24780 [Myxococcota bacterium]